MVHVAVFMQHNNTLFFSFFTYFFIQNLEVKGNTVLKSYKSQLTYRLNDKFGER